MDLRVFYMTEIEELEKKYHEELKWYEWFCPKYVRNKRLKAREQRELKLAEKYKRKPF